MSYIPFLHLFVGVVGPVLFGLAIDRSCLLWEKKCDGSTGACLYYDNHQMAWLLFAVCAGCKVLNIVCGLIIEIEKLRGLINRSMVGPLPVLA